MECCGLCLALIFAGLGLLGYLFRLWMRGPTSGSDNPARLDGKVVAITGCNTGIGKITAMDLAKRGAKILMLCRDTKKANEAAEEIKAATKNELVEVVKLDLASLNSVRECAKQLLEKEEKIDILVNNAGIMMCPEWKTEDGFEMQIGTNHLGHFLLTELLLPLLRKSAQTGFTPRIVIVSSLAHRNGKIYFDDINLKQGYGKNKAYSQSKLANIMHAKELARRVKDDGIRVYSLHPGVIATELSRHLQTGPLMPLFLFMSLFIKTPFLGAQTTLYCCLEKSIEKDTGKYYSDCAEKTPMPQALIEEDQKKLWAISEEMVGLKSKSA